MLVLVNPKAKRARGKEWEPREWRKLFEKAGARAEIRSLAEAEERAETAPAGEWEVWAAAGGDGTVGTVAELAMRHGAALGVIPLGTHNHFAKDLGIPMELEAAARVIAAGKIRAIDAGEVNGRLFLNNASVGAYPRAVVHRERLRERCRSRKMAAMVVALIRVFAKGPLVDARLELDGKCMEAATPFIFVGNNEYKPEAGRERFRTRLDEGRFCIFTAKRGGLGGFLRLAWHSFRGTLLYSRDFQVHSAEGVVIHLAKRQTRISTDGEVWRAEAPLRFRMHKKGLRVMVP